VVNLIKNTTTRAGRRVQGALDPAHYPTHRQVSDDQLSDVYYTRDSFYGVWNYTIMPRQKLLIDPLISS
jgi:hypothetical protein